MQILAWHPRKPPRVTARIFKTGDRLIAEFARRNGRWPKSGVIHLDAMSKLVERIDFEPEGSAP
jgi:hypothetical protein